MEKKTDLYFEKLKKRVPKNLKIEAVTDKSINLANDYLKTRKNLEFKFSPLKSHFGNDWDYNTNPLGYFMRNTENNKIVGFLGTICSRRLIQGKEFVCCNLVHWFVEKEFRVFAYAFFFPLMEREIIVYATTPRDTIIGIYKRFNFDIETAKYTAGVGINILSLFSKNYRRFLIIKNQEDIKSQLNINDRKIFDEHKEYNCINLLIKDKKNQLEPLYLLLKKKKKYNFSILDIIYLSNLKEYKNYAPEICTKICFTLKKLFIGQLYFKTENRLKFNPNFTTKTVERFYPIKKLNGLSFYDYLYSDVIMFDD